MKIATIVAAVALATGSAAFAADHSYSSSGDTARHAQTTQNTDRGASGDGLLAKTKRALHRLGEKMRGAGHETADAAKDRDHDRTAMGKDRNDTRSMGAAGDSSREQRMNKAYGNWQDKQDKGSKR